MRAFEKKYISREKKASHATSLYEKCMTSNFFHLCKKLRKNVLLGSK